METCATGISPRGDAGSFRRRFAEQLALGQPRGLWGLAPERHGLDEVLEDWREALGPLSRPRAVSVYVNFPYCAKSCSFCQYFHVVPHERDQFSRYADYLVASLRRYRAVLGRVRATNAYFGGGTPTALPVADLERFLLEFRQTFRVEGEFTCEAHPGTMDDRKLALLHEAGVTRMSIGVQSLDPVVLEAINRSNKSPEKVARLVAAARERDIEVNVDLVNGLPRQTPESMRASVRAVLAMGPDTITCYQFDPLGRHPVPGPEMNISQVYDAPLSRDAVKAGYAPLVYRPDDASGVRFWRAGRRIARRLANELLWKARVPWVKPEYEPPEGAPERHVIGLGIGAEGHVYGRIYYRESTLLTLADGDRDPVVWGTRLTPEREMLSRVLARLARRRPVDVDAELAAEGLEGSVFATELKLGLGRCGLRRPDGRFLLPALATPEVLPDLLAPVLDPVLSTWTGPELHHALPPPYDYETSFLPGAEIWPYAPPSEYARPVQLGSRAPLKKPEPPPPPAPIPERPGPSEVVKDLLSLGGAKRPGDLLAGAKLTTCEGDTVIVQVLPAPDPPLVIAVARPGSAPCFVRSANFALSYQARPKALAPEEATYLRRLAALDVVRG